jgi:3-hydroxyisobutyrate dehydrogenase
VLGQRNGHRVMREPARTSRLDLGLLREILDVGLMASDVSRIKLEKLVTENYSAQAAIRDVSAITTLVVEQTLLAKAHVPIIEHCDKLY